MRSLSSIGSLNRMGNRSTTSSSIFEFTPYTATGGAETTITQDGRQYKVHTFTSNGTLEITQEGEYGNVEVLAIAGGGGGGSYGGGGAGGYVQALLTPSTGSYPIVIGQGGAGATTNAQGAAGTNTTALGLTAIGGGGGGSGIISAVATAGGSGGGGGAATTEGNYAGPGVGTTAQGLAGGEGNVNATTSSLGGGGGGGAAIAGGIGDTTQPGNGGDGRQSSIDGTLTYRAGGGAGGKGAGGINTSTGGLGGGGNGGGANNGTANLGGGGGGSRPSATAGTGGSGIVIVRYPITLPVKTINVFLVAGQSNCDGRNLITETGAPSYFSAGTNPGVKMWKGAGFEDYNFANIGQYGNGSSYNRFAGTFIESSFLHSYKKWGFADVALNIISEQMSNVVVCRVTQGSSPIAPITASSDGGPVGSWNADYGSIPGGTPRLLEQLEDRFLALKDYCALNNITMNVRGVFWHQGEGDRFDSNPDNYLSRWTAIVAKIRDFTDIPTLPIIYGTITNTSSGYNATIRSAQLSLASGDANAWCRDNNGLTTVDVVHFDAVSSVIFGEWAAETYLDNY